MGLFGNKQTPIPSTTQGAIEKVPCPHCGQPNDFTELNEHQADRGDTAICDKCDGVMQIVRKQQVTIVTVRRVNQRVPKQGGVGQASTISGAQARRMLGRG